MSATLTMKRWARRILTPPLLLGAILASCAAGAAEDPALAGLWLLDAERSDSPERASRRALRDVRRLMQPQGNAPRTSRGTAGARAEEVLAPLSPPTRQVSIELDDVEAIFRIDDRPARRHFTDGRGAVIDSSRPEQTIAAWEDGRLYVEQTFHVGTRIIETWWLDGRHLRADYEARNSLFNDPVRFTLRFTRSATQP